MRFMDYGVAAVIGLIGIGLMYSQSPYAVEHAQVQTSENLRASLAIAHYLDSGYPLTCEAFMAHSNSTVVFGGIVGGTPCASGPKAFLGYSMFVDSKVEIEAWIV